ncbi:hypothetical protein CHI07_12305 [Paenibacillus sp. 7884-2]|nr:hypothetical protein CHI07_12305 [Paenibacillus sp. 7884-2]
MKKNWIKVTLEELEKNCSQDATAFLELHIERGPLLESESLSIGVIEYVLGMICYEIEIIGDLDHAGTTPMSIRKDALFAANNLITEIRDNLSKLSNDLVYTVGRMNEQDMVHNLLEHISRQQYYLNQV